MKVKKLKRQVMTRLLLEDADAIRRLAIDSNRTTSNYVDWVIRQHLAQLRDSKQIDF